MDPRAVYMLKDSSLLMESSYTLIDHYNKRMDLINKYLLGGIQIPRHMQMGMGHAIYSILPKQRWHNIILEVFQGMEPPLLRHHVMKTFLMYTIPEAQMTDAQKARVKELQLRPSGAAVWEKLTNDEQVYIHGFLYGMIYSVENMVYLLQYFWKMNIPAVKKAHPREETGETGERPTKHQKL